jgi:hypothetical protein
MFRCESCGSGYSVQAAATWSSCPRCLAKERVRVPLTFELGWRQGSDDSPELNEPEALDSPLSAPEGEPALH